MVIDTSKIKPFFFKFYAKSSKIELPKNSYSHLTSLLELTPSRRHPFPEYPPDIILKLGKKTMLSPKLPHYWWNVHCTYENNALLHKPNFQHFPLSVTRSLTPIEIRDDEEFIWKCRLNQRFRLRRIRNGKCELSAIIVVRELEQHRSYTFAWKPSTESSSWFL